MKHMDTIDAEQADTEAIKLMLEKLIVDSVRKAACARNVRGRLGILFSGGVDSSLLALVCKRLNIDFTCYTANMVEPGLRMPEDMVYAEKVAERMGFTLDKTTVGLADVRKHLADVMGVIGSANVVKVGVALPFYLAMDSAKKDGVSTILSGLGSEEIFAGYERHRKADDINDECRKGLASIYERDISRDLAIARHFGLDLRSPFLEKNLVDYALKIPGKYKIMGEHCKLILRQAAEAMGLPKEFAYRRKMAAQYGSNFDKAIDKLSKGMKKSEYLRSIMPLGTLFSSGKDSAYALYRMQQEGFEVRCLITMVSENPDSYMFHTPAISMVDLQSESIGIPVVKRHTHGEKEHELEDLKAAILDAKEKHGIRGVVTGAICSEYQRERIQIICDRLSLKVFSPLWHTDQEQELRGIINEGFSFILTRVAALGLDGSWLGREMTLADVDKLVALSRKVGLNVAFEGGEAESLMVDGPIFRKRLEVNGKKNMENEFTGVYEITSAKLL